jgi:hypothetical protein
MERTSVRLEPAPAAMLEKHLIARRFVSVFGSLLKFYLVWQGDVNSRPAIKSRPLSAKADPCASLIL